MRKPQTAAERPQAPAAGATIKAQVRQVVLDVVVTDSRNRAVTGLRQPDFSLSEDGKPQQILSFEAHTMPAAAQVPASSRFKLPDLLPNTFLNFLPGTENYPLVVLLYDLVNTPLESQPFAHEEIVHFLEHKPAKVRVALFVLSDTLHLLQGFTDDQTQLLAAINRKEANPQSSPLYERSEGLHDPVQHLLESATLVNDPDPANQVILGRLQQMEAFSREHFMRERIGQTVTSFSEIVRFLSGLPGRKTLLWLSGSFPGDIFPGSTPLDAFPDPLNYTAELRQTKELFTVGRVAVYPVDIRGLMVDPTFTAANSQTYRTPASLTQAHLAFMSALAAQHGALDQIADDTGGRAFYNTNGLSDAMAASTEDGANYYTLSYAPSNTKFDGGLRKIRVRLDQHGYHLAYRRSYIADSSLAEQAAADAPRMRLEVALRRGAPLAHELSLEAHITTQGQPRAVLNDETEQLAPFPAFASQKNWDGVKIQRYLVEYTIPGSQISMASSEDGGRRANFEFLFAAYDAEDRTMFGGRTPVDKMYSLKSAEGIQKGVFYLRHVLEIPSGATWLRLAVHDALGDRVGSLEIPLPLTTEAAVPSHAAN